MAERGTGQRRARAMAVVLALSLATSCGRARRGHEAPAPLRSPVRDSLFAADAARGEAATRRGLSAAGMTWLDPSVVYLRNGAPVLYGRDAAEGVIGAGLPDVTTGATYRWEPLGGGVARDGRTGYTYGLGIVVANVPQ